MSAMFIQYIFFCALQNGSIEKRRDVSLQALAVVLKEDPAKLVYEYRVSVSFLSDIFIEVNIEYRVKYV